MKDLQLINLVGIWKNEDFPMFNYNDKIEICINIWDKCVAVSIKKPGEEPLTIASGFVKLKLQGNNTFIIQPTDFLNDRFEIQCKYYDGASFVAKIEPYEERYFVKL